MKTGLVHARIEEITGTPATEIAIELVGGNLFVSLVVGLHFVSSVLITCHLVILIRKVPLGLAVTVV